MVASLPRPPIRRGSGRLGTGGGLPFLTSHAQQRPSFRDGGGHGDDDGRGRRTRWRIQQCCPQECWIRRPTEELGARRARSGARRGRRQRISGRLRRPPPLNAAVARPPQATLPLADSVPPTTAGGGGDRSIDGVWRGYGFRRRARVWDFLDFFLFAEFIFTCGRSK